MSLFSFHSDARTRRRGMLLAAAAVAMLVTSLVRGDPVSEEEFPPIPEELQYRRQAIADDENAVTDWLRAAPLLKALDEPGASIAAAAWTPGAAPPTADEWAPVIAWVREHSEPLRWIEDSLHKPKAQWPARSAEEFEPGLAVLRRAATARLALAMEAERDGNTGRSVALILGTAQLGQMAAEGEGALIHYLIGVAVRSMANGAAQRFAAEPAPSPTDLERLLAGLRPLDDEPEVYARTLRVEFTDYVLRPPDAVELAHQWTDALRLSPELMKALVPEELQRAHTIFLTPALVAGHPKPFDHAWAARQYIPRYLCYLRNARAAWANQEKEDDNPEERMRAFLRDAKPVLDRVKRAPLPLNQRAIARVRAAFNRFENPVGRLLAARPEVVDFSPRRSFQARVEREATRTLLALRLYQRQRGDWPEELEELVAAGIIGRLPLDAFSDQPLRYDRKRLIVWSVGQDGRDDGGHSAPRLRWQQSDAVWQVGFRE